MGKKSVHLNITNKELKLTLEYLLASTGYFDFVKEQDDDVTIVSDNDLSLKTGFSHFLSDLFERTGLRSKRVNSTDERRIRIVAMASFRGGIGVSDFALSLSKVLFERGFKVLYLSLNPCNTDLTNARKNEKGFGRWLIDSRNNNVSAIEKYIVEEGELSYVGVPLFNINSGDVCVEDIEKLYGIADIAGYDFLLIDIGTHLDLERMNIFKAADIPLIFMKNEKMDEALLHGFFEGALPLILDGRGERPEESDVADMINEIARREDDE